MSGQPEERIVRLPEGVSFTGFPGEDSIWRIRSVVSTTTEMVGPGANYRTVYIVIVEREDAS